MTRVFLSYAEEDSQQATQLAERLCQEGIKVWYYEDLSQRGGQFIAKIEKEITRAAVFLALLSPDYLSSPWCRHERDMALRREATLQKSGVDNPQLILVLKIRPIEYSDTGFLGNYEVLDLTQSSRKAQQAQLTTLIGALNKEKRERSMSTPSTAAQTSSWPAFVNREHELQMLLHNLTNVAGEHFWLMSAGPQMGKTWLLKELPVRLADQEGIQWTVKLIDLRDELLDSRTDASRLLSRFFDLKFDASESPSVQIAAKISGSGQPWLCLLDSTELLQPPTDIHLRQHFSEIYARLGEAEAANVRLAFVAASRRPHKGWKGISPKPQFAHLPLTHFKAIVVESALRAIAARGPHTFGNSWYRENADRLRGVTEGLPALLVDYMQWIEDQAFIEPERVEERAVFDQLAQPYVSKTLLSVHSLLPSGGDQLAERRNVLEKALLALSPYRLFTQSHLKQIVNENHDLKVALTDLNWTISKLWQTIGDTYLMEPIEEPWRKIYPAIRRLLFRYHYGTTDARAKAHEVAGKFYQGWWNNVPAGMEQGVVLVERLWHQAEYLQLSGLPDAAQALVQFTDNLFESQFTDNLFESVIPPYGYSKEELLDFIEEQMRNDEELQETFAGIDEDLFEKLLQVVEQARSGKARGGPT
jgi:hypothetical protein